jgi:hypothetical protein
LNTEHPTSNDGLVQWRPHPLIDREAPYRRLSDEEIREALAKLGPAAVDEIAAYVKEREARIDLAEKDPFRGEFALPHWPELEGMVKRKTVTFVPGANNSAKSWWAGSLVVRTLLRRFTWDELPAFGLRVLMISQDDDASKMFQQPAVYAHLPAELRSWNERGQKKRDAVMKLNYTQAGGFTEGTFVLPRPIRGQCFFKTVAQYLREPQSFEGPAYHLVVIDEGCPLPLFETLLGRVGKVSGKVVYLLTCVNGHDAVLGRALEGARLVKTLAMQTEF